MRPYRARRAGRIRYGAALKKETQASFFAKCAAAPREKDRMRHSLDNGDFRRNPTLCTGRGASRMHSHAERRNESSKKPAASPISGPLPFTINHFLINDYRPFGPPLLSFCPGDSIVIPANAGIQVRSRGAITTHFVMKEATFLYWGVNRRPNMKISDGYWSVIRFAVIRLLKDN